MKRFAYVALALALGLVVYMWSSWDDTMDVLADAEQFAAEHTQGECVTESLSRLRSCGRFGLWCQDQSITFARTCLDIATEDPQLCTHVPEQLPAAMDWAAQVCPDPDLPGKACERIYRAVGATCVYNRP